MEFAVSSEADTTTVAIRGEFDAKTAPEARPKIDELLGAQPRRVIVDLSQLRLIDSTGVGGIVSMFKRVGAYGGAFEVRGVTGQPRSIFQVLRLDRVFGLEDKRTD
ncbi:MAG: STAS domain-containing protein [Polyangiaceae bacterium]|nr:STAS domain-containing protein [Polyangiaceae bacterium]